MSRAFKGLATQAEILLKQAATIVSCVEKESMSSVLSSVQSLCLTLREFLGRRLKAATAILETLQQQEQLLLQLILITQNQEGIASHLRALSVLTNVEVARLGSTGGNFQLLAQELSKFSKSLASQTLELARDTAGHQQTIASTRRELAANLPRLRSEMSHMEEDLAKTLRVIDADLSRQSSIPSQFHRCAEDTARQIAGVVAALQAHDITRQQIEHVQHSLQLIAARVEDRVSSDSLPSICAGLQVQTCQLKTIQQTVTHWTSQVRTCMNGIQQLSASDVAEIGTTVLQQEQELSCELARIEQLQRESQEYSGRMRGTLSGLSSLVELVNVHLKRSQAIRDRLQILMFNSLIEAQRLGGCGAVVSAIAGLIKEVSEEWNAIAQRSRLALNEILGLVERTNMLMEAFSEASSQQLRENQTQTNSTLHAVRDAAAFVAAEAGQMQSIAETMQTNLALVANTGNRLEVCFGHLETVLSRIEGLCRKIENTEPGAARQCDTAEVEKWLSSVYTTETERTVMSASLHGTAMPVVQASFEGNAVELF